MTTTQPVERASHCTGPGTRWRSLFQIPSHGEWINTRLEQVIMTMACRGRKHEGQFALRKITMVFRRTHFASWLWYAHRGFLPRQVNLCKDFIVRDVNESTGHARCIGGENILRIHSKSTLNNAVCCVMVDTMPQLDNNSSVPKEHNFPNIMRTTHNNQQNVRMLSRSMAVPSMSTAHGIGVGLDHMLRAHMD